MEEQTYIIKKVFQFNPVQGGITPTTLIAVARRSVSEDPADLVITPEDIRAYLRVRGMIEAAGSFANDEVAGTFGVEVNNYYTLSNNNSYNLPGGLIKKRMA